MRLGITAFLTDRDMTPAALAQAVEEAGFDALYLPEHTHLPVGTAPPALHPCGRAAKGLEDAGHVYDRKQVKGGRLILWSLWRRGRDRAEVEQLSGQWAVPILVLDDGEVITGSLMRSVAGPDMGVKASGGIRTLDDLRVMVAAGASLAGRLRR